MALPCSITPLHMTLPVRSVIVKAALPVSGAMMFKVETTGLGKMVTSG
jgi:hypothetical protein